MTNQQGAPEAPKSTALDGKTELFHVPGHPLLVRAVDFNRLYAENAALQQGYDAARLEIDHFRGATKMVEPAQPVAWLVYLPSIDTQNVYDSQDDPGYVDDVTNHADAEVTPLYEMAAPKAEVAPAGEYPPLPTGSAWCGDDDVRDFGAGAGESALMFEPTQTQHVPLFTAGQMRAYVDADRGMRAQAAPQQSEVASSSIFDGVIPAAIRSYLRTCSSGGMPKKNIDIVQVNVDEAERLGYFKLAIAEAVIASRVAAPQPAPVAHGDARLAREGYDRKEP